jgi:hypothetical protein
MFEAPFQALPGTSGLLQKRPVRLFAVKPSGHSRHSGPGGYKAANPTFNAPVAAAETCGRAMFSTILLKCCARNLNQSFMLGLKPEGETY